MFVKKWNRFHGIIQDEYFYRLKYGCIKASQL